MFHIYKIHNKHKQKGISLIELMVAMALTIIVIGMGFKIYLSLKKIYKTKKTETSISVRELSTKKVIYEAISNAGLSCKYGVKTQKYINRTGDFEIKNNFVYDNTTIRVGDISQISDYLRVSLANDYKESYYQANTDFIMLKKEDSFAKLATTPINLSLNLDRHVNWNNDDYLALCNNDYIDIVKVESSNKQYNYINLVATPFGDYGKGDYIGKFDINILYISDTGNKNENGDTLYSLNLFTNNGSKSSSYAMIDGVSDLKISYALVNNQHLRWRNIEKTIDVDKTNYKALKIAFKVDNKPFERVVFL